MGIKKIVMCAVIMAFFIPLTLQSAVAFNPNWEEDQREMFQQIGLKPGDVIDQSNWQKGKDLLPESIVNWLKKGEWILKIGEFKYDYSPDEEFMKATAKNAGKYGLGTKKEIIDLATGKYPVWVYGYPFPNVDVKNDPDGPVKLMHNQYSGLSRCGSSNMNGAALEWVGEGGYERKICITGLRFNFWQRPDGEVPNARKMMKQDVTPCLRPYDVKGYTTLAFRPLDGSTEQIFAYIPSIRRVKRMSGSNRSDPTMGSDTCLDDENGWSGNNSSMKWKFLDEKIMLMPVTEWCAERTKKYIKQPDGTWVAVLGQQEQRVGYQEGNWTGAPWAMTNAVWVPRRMYVVEADPLDPFYTYGPAVIYVDAGALVVTMKIQTNRAAEYWKTIIVTNPCSEWGGRKTFTTINFTLGVDDRTHHAATCISEGTHQDYPECVMRLNAQEVVQRMFTPANIRMWSK